MGDYDFTTLNDKEFEVLCLDLLNAKHKLNLQAFKVGKDKGVDLRYSTSKNNNEIIVQAKHYSGSGYAQLKHTLKEKELDKIKKLKPNRYIIVTSLPLSASDKDELKDILNPFVQNSNDVFGKDDLNAILREHSEIEKNHFKLWFSSITVLESIFNNAIEGRTKHHLENIKGKIPLYVLTQKLDVALNILQKEKLLLITGQPGIGKTTLADILLFEKAKNGFKVYKVENIREAEDVMSIESEDKQLFYFDDFLGSNYFEIVSPHRTESQLTSFVERVKNTPNKYLVLTTRTVILNYAREKFEKISHSRIVNHQFELKLTDYTKYEKAQILYNHLFFNKVNEALYESILNEKFYRAIIQHKNYTPRIMEFITDKSKIDSFTPDSYHQFIRNNLNNPKEIWRYSLNNQIGYLDKCLLLTLFSFQGSTSEQVLVNAFENRLDYEKKEHNQVIDSNQFNQSIRILLDGFISSTIVKSQGESREYSFINPSLTDFLIGYLSTSFQERKGIISSIRYVEQLYRFDSSKTTIPLEKELQIILRNKISKGELGFIEEQKESFSDNERCGSLLAILVKYCGETSIDTLLLDNFKGINFSDRIWPILQKLQYVMLNLGDAPLTNEYIKSQFEIIIAGMIRSISEVEEAEKIPELFRKYEQDYDKFTESDEGFENLLEVIDSVLKTNEETLKDEKESEIKDMSDVDEIYDEIYEIEQDLKQTLFPNTTFDYDFGIEADHSFWEDKIEENLKRAAAEEAEAEMYYEQYKENQFERRSEDEAIDDLFHKPN